MSQLLEYFNYFKEANTEKLKIQAQEAAKEYCLNKYGVSWDGKYIDDYLSYVSRYIHSYCDSYARHKLGVTN